MPLPVAAQSDNPLLAQSSNDAAGMPLIRVHGGASEVTDAHKRTIIGAILSGQTLRSLLAMDLSLPHYGLIYAALQSDAEFAEAYELARQAGLETRLEESLDYQASVRADHKLSAAAEKYASVTAKLAALMAPKRFGQLVRHAGHDGEQLVVQTVQYASKSPGDDAKVIDG